MVKNCWRKILYSTLFSLITACSGVNTSVCEYKIDAFSPGKIMQHPTPYSLLVNIPTVSAGYDTERMLYTQTPYSLHAFARSEWVSSPGNMFYPLLIQSLQQSNYFSAVVGGAAPYLTDYRLDTQIIALHQNFICKPSVIELVVQGVLTRVSDQKVIASRIFTERVPCVHNTPYDGVIAANQATKQLTAHISNFVRRHVMK